MIFNTPSKDFEALVLSLCQKERAKMFYLHRVGKAICKPLFKCLMCMSSFWGCVAWVLLDFSFNIFLMVPIVCGINTIITALISNLLPIEDE